MAKLIQARCNEVLGYVPEIIYSNRTAKSEKSLELHYKIKKLLGIFSGLRCDYVSEIDNTLRMCVRSVRGKTLE
jgi:hypothetical protein